MRSTIRYNLAVRIIALVSVIVVLGILATLFGLGGASYEAMPPMALDLGRAVQQGQQAGQGQQGQQVSGGSGNETLETQERVILRSASLRVVVSDAVVALNDIASLAEEMGGWVVSSSINRVSTASGEETARGSIVVRVVADRLDEALARIKSGTVSVEAETVAGEDVTQQYIDLTSRLNNLEAAEIQLQSIMENARRTEDVLGVYNELVRVRGDIEVLQGQIQYYTESAEFASISVELVPQALETPIQIVGWSPEGTARSAFLALLNVLRFIVDLIITLGVLVLPLVVIVGVPGWWLYRKARRRKVS